MKRLKEAPGRTVGARTVGAPLVLACRLPGGVDEAHAQSAAARIGIDLQPSATGPLLPLGAGDSLERALRVQAALTATAIDRVGSVPAALAALASPAHGRSGGVLRLGPDGRVTLSLARVAPIDLGEPAEAEVVLLRRAMLREAEALAATAPSVPKDAGDKAREVLFGTPRTLSDPSSRKVLEAFGIASAPHRLADTAARAAAHARALGGSVDLRLASPDLHALDHRELGAFDLRAPGEVREAQRALLRGARERRADARVLGVTVSAHVPAVLRLEVRREGFTLRFLESPAAELAGPVEAEVPTTLGGALVSLALSAGRAALFKRPLAELLARVGTMLAALPSLSGLDADLGRADAPLVVAARVHVR